MPISCAEARGTHGVDFATRDTGAGPWERYRCLYELPRLRQLYPEHNGLSDDALIRKLYAAVNQPVLEEPFVVRAVASATVPPILTLLLGLVLRWVVAGFRAPT